MNYKNKKDDAATDAWLGENGILGVFHQTLQHGVSVLQARMVATNLLKQNSSLLSHAEVAALNNFLQISSTKKLCNKVTSHMCFKIMNIGSRINRGLFSSHKKLKGHSQ
jgi:hypothetical protein